MTFVGPKSHPKTTGTQSQLTTITFESLGQGTLAPGIEYAFPNEPGLKLLVSNGYMTIYKLPEPNGDEYLKGNVLCAAVDNFGAALMFDAPVDRCRFGFSWRSTTELILGYYRTADWTNSLVLLDRAQRPGGDDSKSFVEVVPKAGDRIYGISFYLANGTLLDNIQLG